VERRAEIRSLFDRRAKHRANSRFRAIEDVTYQTLRKYADEAIAREKAEGTVRVPAARAAAQE